MFSRRSIFLLALAFAIARPAFAQQTVDVGSISGRVTDGSGAAVPGATVTAVHRATNINATAITDHDGRFRFPYLRIGAYDVKVTLAGFAEVAKQLTISA